MGGAEGSERRLSGRRGSWMKVWWWMGDKGRMEQVGKGSRVRDMYARGYTWHIWWDKGSRWRHSDTELPVC